jgi:hypothetical protein
MLECLSWATLRAFMIKVAILQSYRSLQNFPADLRNAVRYGIHAPKRYQTIYINPRDVKFVVAEPSRYKPMRTSGEVLSGDWDLPGTPIGENTAFIHKRIQHNLPWKETGAYERMMAKIARFGTTDKCSNIDDVVRRYNELDRFISHLENGGRFLSRRETCPKTFREFGGVVIHIGRNGELLGSEKGNHRLVIAQELLLRWIPAQVGVVHSAAVMSGAFHKLTKQPPYSQHANTAQV